MCQTGMNLQNLLRAKNLPFGIERTIQIDSLTAKSFDDISKRNTQAILATPNYIMNLFIMPNSDDATLSKIISTIKINQ